MLNTLKLMITDGDILEKSDMYILDSVKGFITSPGVKESQASQQLLQVLERLVRLA